MPKPAPRKSSLGKKAGPLPVWAWLALGLFAAAGLYIFLRGRGGKAPASPVEIVTGATRGTPQQAAYGGYPAQATPTQDMISADVLAQLLASPSSTNTTVTELRDTFGNTPSSPGPAIYGKIYQTDEPGHPRMSNAFFTDPGLTHEISVPNGLYYGDVIGV